MRLRPFWLILLAAFGPAAAAETHGLKQAQAELLAARQESAAHRAAAAKAADLLKAEAARAAALAGQQIAAAASLRGLEDQTAEAANAFASLQMQRTAATVELQRSAAALAELLPVMQRLVAEPAASLLAVPQPPADAVRGIIVLQAIAAEIAKRAAAVKQQTAMVASLSAKTKTQQAVLGRRVAAQSQAEMALSRQIQAARAAETADTQTVLKERAAALVADRKLHDLNDIVAKLMAMPAPPRTANHDVAAAPPGPSTALQAGAGAPVAGKIIQKFGDNTAAGPAEGVSYQAAPGARVVTPCAGPVKFADRFQNYGKVVITDCGGGYYLVLSGLDELDVSAGETLARGQPIGEMLGFDPANPARQPLLYVELRHNGTPINPTAWLAGGSG